MWIFEKRSPYGVVVAPKNEEFFVSDKRDSAQSLVREVSQNSGDAGLSHDVPVVLTFDFREIEREYFIEHCVDALRPHLDACSAKGLASGILDESGPVRYLAIEDFETTGLEGGYTAAFDESSNFINFWRRYGESSKGGESGGRHGVGKSTIAAASRLHFFYGATVRASDKKMLLYGQATLAVHQLENDASVCDPYGLFSPGKGPEAVPFEDDDAAWFTAAFDLKRSKRPGLSLVIPFPREEVTESSIVKAAIEHCFHQIISGHLIIRVGSHELSRKTIREHAEKFTELNGLLGAIDISLHATATDGQIVFNPLPTEKDIRLSQESFTEVDLQSMKALWDKGETVAVKIPAKIHPKGGKEKIGYVTIYISPEQDVNRARETYIRGRVTVIARKSQGKFVGLFVAQDDIVSQFLGDAEPPAHDRWLMYKVKPLYVKPEDAFRKLLNSLSDLYGILAEGEADKPLKDALTKFFWTPDTTKPEGKERLPMPDFVPPPPPESKPFDIRKIPEGFIFAYKKLKSSKQTNHKVSYRIEVRYDVRRGKPSWDKADFDFSDPTSIDIEATGKGTIDVETEPGTLHLWNVEGNYELKVRGFDPRRDLLLSVSEVERVN